MAVQLEIRDGSPHWYLSPDIWVVPGADPAGAPGPPIAGQTAYLWARVSNSGSTAANGVRVDFYWANPALQVTRSNATLVGSAFADVPAQGAQDALCLVPWVPVVVNDGHECLVAVANHSSDPLPNPLHDAFDPPAYRQVAQKNLTVFVASLHPMMLTLTVSGLQRSDKAVVLSVEIGGELDARTLAGLGLRPMRPAPEHAVEAGLSLDRRCVGEKDPIGSAKLEVAVRRGRSTPVYAAVRAKPLARDEYTLVRIVERSEGKELGGLALVVVSQQPGKRGSDS